MPSFALLRCSNLANPRLSMSGIHKTFGSTQALRGVDLELFPGEVHALVGENGAGKSTLMKILSGAVRPDVGHMLLDGQPYAPRDPGDARNLGVAMIYQELTLAPHLTVEANALLGVEPARWGVLRGQTGRAAVRAALATLEHATIPVDAPVSSLSPAAQQVVEIARALLLQVRVLVFDEPTSSLTQADAVHLFRLIRTLRERGVALVYISHFLEEVRQVADRFTVLRDGQSVASGTMSEFSTDRIIEHMVGRTLDDLFPRVPHAIGAPILTLTGLTPARTDVPIDLTLHRGEILGLAGIVGAGRTELLRAIFGLDAVRRGEIVVETVAGQRASRTRPRIEQGIGLVSEDRKEEGLALSQSIADNLTYSKLQPYTRWGWLRRGRRQAAVRDWLARLQVRCSSPDQPVGELSGGNQQKLALGRLLHQGADILLLDEPTRGIDVGSKAEIYRLIGELAAQGKAILFVSSYLPELLGVCDRLAVMNRGRLGVVRPIAEWTPERVMTEATRSTTQSTETIP